MTTRRRRGRRARAPAPPPRLEPPGYGDMPVAGLNYRISDIHCAIGIPQLQRLEELLATRERVAAGYEERLADLTVDCRRATRATATAGRPT